MATLVIVAYKGIQQRAENANTISAVEAYQKALIQYATDKGSYPITAGAACFGEDNLNAKCYGGQHPEVPAFNDTIRPYLGNKNPLPLPSAQKVNGSYGGMLFISAAQTIDGVSHPWFIWYVMAGNGTQCTVGRVVGGNYPTYTSNPSTGYSVAVAGGSYCWVQMPDPTKL